MRMNQYHLLMAIFLLAHAAPTPAQEREPPPRNESRSEPRNEPRNQRPDRPGFGPRMMFRTPLNDALDANSDGKLSNEELKGAAAALKKLDKDNDGKLTAEEIGWPPQFGGRGRGGFGPGGPGGRGDQSRVGLAERMMKRDANADGKVTAEELPRSMQVLLRRADTDQDGAVNETEAKELAKEIEPRANAVGG